MNKIKIFVVTHKKFDFNLTSIYCPIQVGKCNTNANLPYITDDTGINISNNNKNYCELTAVYWAWKNLKKVDVIGIVHYRRYFVYGITSKIIDEKYINKYLSKFDIILPTMYKTESNVYNHFINSPSGRERDLINLRKVIKKIYPEYLKSYDDVMNSRKASYCNMMVTSYDNYKKYCEWLFNILFELEKITDLTGYSIQEQRIYGFLSEFLLNVWVKNQKLKVKYCDVYYIENNKIKNFLKRIKLGMRGILK